MNLIQMTLLPSQAAQGPDGASGILGSSAGVATETQREVRSDGDGTTLVDRLDS